MADLVDVGIAANDGTGDRLREAFQKINTFAAKLPVLPMNLVGDGMADDGPALQVWLDSIPSFGAGRLPPASVYYKSGTALTLSGFKRLIGDGLTSRIHYTGVGVGLTWTDARFSSIDNTYLTYTSVATGGCWIKGAQEGFYSSDFYCEYSDSIGTSQYAIRFSSSWVGRMTKGRMRGAIGVWLDDTNYGGYSVVNNFTLDGVECAPSTICLRVDSGHVINAINGCDFEGGTTGVMIACGVTGTAVVNVVNIIGNYLEGLVNAVLIGGNAALNGPNLSSGTPTLVTVRGNRLDASGVMIRIFKGDLCVIGENEWGAGTITIDSGVTRTLVETVQAVTNNAAAGQTTFIRPGSIQISEVHATVALIAPTYTVAGLPSASPAGQFIYVSNESGGATHASSDGVNWRRVADRAVVS